MKSKPQKNPEVVRRGSFIEAPVFPMRINKFLAHKKHSTRRGADDLIRQKKVFINGKLALLGDKVLESDIVEVRFRAKIAPSYDYFAFNKPIGMITGAQNRSEIDIVRSLPIELQRLKLFPLGRLDKNSEGLIILTNDGRITDRLLNPKYEHKKEYEVKVAKPLRSNFKQKIEAGVNIEGYLTKPSKIKIIGPNKFIIDLIEGKTHQIRRMISALFNEVTLLKRTRIMNIGLTDLKPGMYRKIEGSELQTFLHELDLA